MSEAAIRAAVARLVEPPGGPSAAMGADVPARAGAADELTARVCAKTWRRSRVAPETWQDIRTKLVAAIEAGRPIEFAVPFGGYKGARQPSAPHPDWAELFWIAHLRRYAQTLAAVHPPGVLFSLSYFHGVLGEINNLSADDQDAYIGGLRALLAHFSDARIGFRLVDLSECFGGAAGAVAAIERRFQALQASMQEGEIATLPLRSAARNLVRRREAETPAPAEIVASALRCVAMESLDERRRFNKFGPRIQITHIRGASLALHLGSCATSIMQPWVGTGVMEGDGAGGWRPRIVNACSAPPDTHVAVRHALEDIAPALRTVPVTTGGARP